MAALFELASPKPVLDERERDSARQDPPGVTAGLAYVNRCLAGHRPFGILTGSAGSMEPLVTRCSSMLAAREELHAIRVTSPTDSVQTFLADCLAQLGFDLGEAGLDDLHNLLVVFLRHEGARGRRTIALVDSTEHCGPRVLEFMQTLSKVRAGATPAITFLLTGSRDLHRVLDSQGMAGLRPFTRERFDLDRALAWITPGNRPASAERLPGIECAQPGAAAPAPVNTGPGQLVVMLDGAIVQRLHLTPGRLVIGRSPRTGLRLDSRYVSRHHAALIVAEDAVTVIDLRSTNATLVNGQAVASHLLEHGDLLAIGNFRIRYDRRSGH